MLFRLYLIGVFVLKAFSFDSQTEPATSTVIAAQESDSPQEQLTDQSTDKTEQNIVSTTNVPIAAKTMSIQIIPLNRQRLQLKQLNNSEEYFNEKLSKQNSIMNNNN